MPDKFQSILLGALIVGLLASIFGLVQFSVQSQVLGTAACCIIPTVGAMMAVWHYTSTNELTILLGEGAKIGFASCALGYVVSLVLSLLISFTGLIPSPFDVDAVLEITQNTMIEAGNSEEEISAAIGFIEQFFYLFTLIGFVVYGLIGAIVGAIGANLNKHGSAEAVQ